MEIKSVDFIKSSTSVNDCPQDDKSEIAFIGRSNVGKSSLINMLCKRKKLAKTSSTPGKTQLINLFDVEKKWRIVDLPGYGWARVSKTKKAEWEKFIAKYLLERPNLRCVLVLVDIRHSVQAIDLEFMTWLAGNDIDFALIFTKSDKLGKVQVAQTIAKYKKELLQGFSDFPTYCVTSSETSDGRKDVLSLIEEILN